MATRMLIDARHQEETRVAVLKGNRIEEFDFESADHRQIKGNIYLAKVTRVEPSLQAAFVDFGGNRHGFLAFSEIHPDYYQIPKEDREALLAAEAEVAEEEARLREEEEDRGEMPGDEYDAEDESAGQLAEDLAEDGIEEVDTSDKDEVATIEDGHVENGFSDEDEGDNGDDETEADAEDEGRSPGYKGRGRRQGKGGRSRAREVDEARARRMALRRRYKIQDVIQRRQVLLVQVVKEERGNKGAALTTYLSLAGRYTVLMPNSSHGGGISRKISSAQDRKRLKQIVSDLTLPRSMGLIVRTAGLQRTKPEIKRDFDYLARLWDEIREKTLASSAPALIHSDSDLIKRAIRDIYNKEIEEVVVEGDVGYKSAKEFMKLLMPSHARRVKQYADPVPLFQRYGAEDQLKAMYDPVVQLKSGGYLVINPTEALVSIDINSGRSTREHNIEQTALSTNLEAAREIARQLRLRDMAGLVVIDFIDQEHHSNTRKVEKAMKEALKHDRARIQVGRISSFGLMEMSRQRLRTGVLEATTRDCPHCDGTGLVRTASSAGLSALRLIEEEAARGRGTVITLAASTEAAVYLLNEKRADLMEIEERYGVTVVVRPEGEDEGAKMNVASSGPRPTALPKFEIIVEDDEDDFDAGTDADEDEAMEADAEADDRPRKRRRRRGGRGRSKRRDDEAGESEAGESEAGEDEAGEDEDGESENGENGAGSDTGSDETAFEGDDDGDDRPKKRRRRGGRRRGGRGRANHADDMGEDAEEGTFDGASASEEAPVEEVPVEEAPAAAAPVGDIPAGDGETKPKPRRSRKKKTDDAAADVPLAEAPAADEPAAKPKRTRRKKVESEAVAETPTEAVAKEAPAQAAPKPARARRKKIEPEPAAEAAAEAEAPASRAPAPETPTLEAADGEDKPRRGWWQRTFGE
ncbi:MAG: Rne/Rng family ribonuclease [Erythrobacter sp.]|jgi:ribonuclease E